MDAMRRRGAAQRRAMTNLVDGLRATRTNLKRVDGRALLQRTGAMFGGPWGQRSDGSVPNWLNLLVRVSDDGLRVPGTPVRVGLDAILGALLPGAGDALGGVTAAVVMFVAWQRGAPRDVLFKMLRNAGADIAFGAIPVVGDIFDLGFHANRMNLDLLQEHMQQKTRAERASRASMIAVFVLLGVMMLLALAIAAGLIVAAWKHWGPS
jgi:uncharacterized protein DUF4112